MQQGPLGPNKVPTRVQRIVAAPDLDDEDFAALALACEEKGFACLRNGLRNHLAGIDVGLSRAELGVAGSGTCMMNTDNEDVRLAGMISEIHVILLRKSDIYPDLPSIAQLLRERMNAAPATYTTLITGPSRTADIERVGAVGVHGPLNCTSFFWRTEAMHEAPKSLSDYRKQIDEALQDDFLRRTLDTFAVSYRANREAVFQEVDERGLIAKIAEAKDYACQHMEELYQQFKEQAEKRGVHVHRAATAKEANEIIARIAKENDVKRVVKSKSMTAEEIQLNPALGGRRPDRGRDGPGRMDHPAAP